MIRPYRSSDTEQIIAIWRDSSALAHPFLNDAFVDKEERLIRDSYLQKTKTWVMEENEKLTGFISMLGNEVGAIFVRPVYLGKGIGYKLMNLVAKEYKEVEVEVFKENTIGRAFYDRYGFKFKKQYTHKETGQEVIRLKYP